LFLLVGLLLAAGCRSQGQRYVFVDGGAHFGESYKAFQKCNLYSQYPWEIFAIEANPHLVGRLPKAPRLTVIGKAMWVTNGTLQFHLQDDTSGSNSLFERTPGETRTGVTRPVDVPSFDFSQWVKTTFSKADYVILSMDIEGAEYEVLDKMFADGSVDYLDRLYVEFHEDVLTNVPPAVAKRRGPMLLRRAKQFGLIVGDDSTEGMMKRGDWIDFLL
jgi:FkbM family methyltransferase